MAKLFFRYGTMDSSKTANLIMVDYNYREQGKRSVILKPRMDTRSGEGLVKSRLGVSAECIDIHEEDDLVELVGELLERRPLDCILVDECQWLTFAQGEQLARVVDRFNIPVLCYGLKNSYVKGLIFEGSRALLYYADSIEEIKTVCTYCSRKATMNLRVVGHKPVYSGDPVQVGDVDSSGAEYYIPVCRRHYFDPPLTEQD